MMPRVRSLWLLLPVLALIAAGPAASPPDDLIRRGNDAVGRKQYGDALQLYDLAEERATDPGLVAFNAGVALYHQGNYPKAEAHFRLARQDATGPRRAWAAYNLGACLLQTAGANDVARLDEAVHLFQECADQDERLAADARHNLELAKLLWLQARARPDPQRDKAPPDEENPGRPPPPKQDPVKQPGGDDGPGSPVKGSAERQHVAAQGGPDPIQTDAQPAPGEGSLPVIPDRDELVPMSREEAEAHLRQAIERVTQEGRAHQRRPPRMSSGKVRDW